MTKSTARSLYWDIAVMVNGQIRIECQLQGCDFYEDYPRNQEYDARDHLAEHLRSKHAVRTTRNSVRITE